MDIDRIINRGVSQITPYVFGKPKEEVEKKHRLLDTVKLNSNENPIGVSPIALEHAGKSGIFGHGRNEDRPEGHARAGD